MYFKCHADSETGKKFKALFEKGKVLRAECLKLANKYGFENYARPDTMAFGGIEAFTHPYNDAEDLHIYKIKNGFYFPRRKFTKGKQILEEMKFIGFISRLDLNNVIGLNDWHVFIGFNHNKDSTLFGFSMDNEWGFLPPKDCIEITGTEYKELFKEESK